MEDKEIQNELASIRSLMERSSKFISLSGLSGILAGVYALVGAGFLYHVIYHALPELNPFISSNKDIPAKEYFYQSYDYYIISFFLMSKILSVSLLVLFASVSTGVLLTFRKAKRIGQSIWGTSSRVLLFNMTVPLAVGGILMLVLLKYNYYGLIAPASLIFYGLALIGASNFTFSMVRYLGICEIILGLIAACLPGYGLTFWAFGFGVLHIVYGSMMYFKYDR